MSKEKKIAYFCPIHPPIELYSGLLKDGEAMPLEQILHCPECNKDHKKRDCIKLEYEE